MDPVTLAAIATAGSAVSAIGSIVQGQAASDAAGFNAQVAEQNATMTRQQGAEDERRFRVSAKKHLGDMRANYGASGIQLDGSALAILEESAATAELDALTIKHGANVRARAYEQEADLARYSGRQAKIGSYFGAGSSLLLGGAQAFGYGKNTGKLIRT